MIYDTNMQAGRPYEVMKGKRLFVKPRLNIYFMIESNYGGTIKGFVEVAFKPPYISWVRCDRTKEYKYTPDIKNASRCWHAF
jgi:hypothetical protein